MIYSKQLAHETTIIVINNSTDKIDVTIPYDFTDKNPVDLWNNEPLKETANIELAPYSFSIVKITT